MSLVFQFKSFANAKGLIAHNTNDGYRQSLENVDSDRVKDNVVFDMNLSNFTLAREKYKKYHKEQSIRDKAKGRKVRKFREVQKNIISDIVISFNKETDRVEDPIAFFEFMKKEIELDYPKVKKNMVSSVVHLDEETPHMHITFHNIETKMNRGRERTKINSSFYDSKEDIYVKNGVFDFADYSNAKLEQWHKISNDQIAYKELGNNKKHINSKHWAKYKGDIQWRTEAWKVVKDFENTFGKLDKSFKKRIYKDFKVNDFRFCDRLVRDMEYAKEKYNQTRPQREEVELPQRENKGMSR